MREKGGKNERICALTRQVFPRDQLIRFVLSPEGTVIPDLKEDLPGRGVWLEARQDCIRQAVKKNVFAKAFRQTVNTDPDLPGLVEQLLRARALEALGMARKAGQLTTGFTKVESALRSGKAVLILHAVEAAEDGRRKLASAMRAAAAQSETTPDNRVVSSNCLSSREMSGVVGQENVMHAAVLTGGAGRFLGKAIERLERYVGSQAGSEPPANGN